jgi:hypothetical protein
MPFFVPVLGRVLGRPGAAGPRPDLPGQEACAQGATRGAP